MNGNHNDSPHGNGHATNQFGGRSKIQPLELELEMPNDAEERDSLLYETTNEILPTHHDRASTRLTLRKGAAHQRAMMAAARDNATSGASVWRGLLRQAVGNQLSFRHFVALASLGVIVVAFVRLSNHVMETFKPVDVKQREAPKHSGSFGGNKNTHFANPTASGTAPAPPQSWAGSSSGSSNYEHPLFPKSNIGHAVHSLNQANLNNSVGHYWHDPRHSPYASLLYQHVNTTMRHDEQAAYEARKANMRTQFGGEWISPATAVPGADQLLAPWYKSYNYRDVPHKQFDSNDWQANRAYVTHLISQAQSLVHRVREGIYTEYGYGEQDAAQSAATQTGRERKFQILVDNYEVRNGMAVDNDGKRLPGVAYLHQGGLQGLTRKLLHAMMTENVLYVVAVGEATTYRGQNFMETQIMQFHHLMEPVLDLLGIKLISRNMGMNASTTVSALGGADVWGEADILWYLPRSGSTQESDGQLDLLYRQAILSGERMPLILTPNPVSLLADTNNQAWLGNIQPGLDVCDATTLDEHNIVHLPTPYACHYMKCDERATAKNICDTYVHGQCWLPRKDERHLNPETQQDRPPRVAGNDPNYAVHKWASRKLALLVLYALEQALQVWSDELGKISTTEQLAVIPDSVWHVGPTYESLRESVRTLERRPGETVEQVPACEKFLTAIDAMICHLSMHVFTEWTPRAVYDATRLKNQVVEHIYDAAYDMKELYHGPDLLVPEWRIPDDQVDVHLLGVIRNDEATEYAEIPPGAYLDDDQLASMLGKIDGIDDDEFYFLDDETRHRILHFDDAVMIDDDFMRRQNRRQRTLRSRATIVQRRHGGKIRWRRQSKVWDRSAAAASLPSTTHRRPAAARQLAGGNWRADTAPTGFCDGSSQSTCNRQIGNDCLLANYNAYPATIVGTSASGWLTTLVPIEEGILLARFQLPPLTTALSGPKAQMEHILPNDFVFVSSVAETTETTYTRQEFLDRLVELAPDLLIFPLLLDKDMETSETEEELVPVGIRFETRDTSFQLALSHLYYS